VDVREEDGLREEGAGEGHEARRGRSQRIEEDLDNLQFNC